MTDEQFNALEHEVIVLLASWSLIDEIVNYSIFEKDHGISDTILMPSSRNTQRVFNILLVDFLSPPQIGRLRFVKSSGEPPENKTLLIDIGRVAQNPILGQNPKCIWEPIERFQNWLFEDCVVPDAWFPSLGSKISLTIKRIEFLRICGNASKHSFVRLGRDVDKLVEVFDRNEHSVSLSDGYLALGEFQERFGDDVLNYHCTFIAEMLNNIRWGIYDYMQDEFERSFRWVDQTKRIYKFKCPGLCISDLTQVLYWELMNKAIDKPYFPKFSTSDSLKTKY